jgi:hypothetical protein
MIPIQGKSLQTNYVTRDNFGMYALSTGGPGPALMGANTLLGNDVYNKDGEDLGDKLFAVPWAALTLDMANKRFTLNVPKVALKDAPGFNKDHWPLMSDKTWASGVHKFYGTHYAQ